MWGSGTGSSGTKGRKEISPSLGEGDDGMVLLELPEEVKDDGSGGEVPLLLGNEDGEVEVEGP